jgi:hypothetical protein
VRWLTIARQQDRAASFGLDGAASRLGVLMLAEILIAMSAPSRANSTATARPIPESAPVISATLPASFDEPR